MDEETQPRRVSGLRRFIDSVTGLVNGASGFLDEAWLKANNLTQTNYELACDMVRQGRVADAIFRFKVTLWLAPGHVASMYNLGCLYHHKGENRKALNYFQKVIAAEPQHEAAIYMVATIDPSLLKAETRPTMVPNAMLVEYFDGMANSYDAIARQYMYKLPDLAHQLLHQHMDERVQKQNLLDIGCGTGMSGAVFREEFINIYGVDVSSGMLNVAAQRFDKRGVKIYSRIYQQDARIYMNSLEKPITQVVTALSVMPYIGDAEPFFIGLNKALVMQGLAVISFDAYQDADFAVMPSTGYFGHHPGYIQKIAQKYGFDLLRAGEVEARAGQFTELCIFRKSAEVSG